MLCYPLVPVWVSVWWQLKVQDGDKWGGSREDAAAACRPGPAGLVVLASVGPRAEYPFIHRGAGWFRRVHVDVHRQVVLMDVLLRLPTSVLYLSFKPALSLLFQLRVLFSLLCLLVAIYHPFIWHLYDINMIVLPYRCAGLSRPFNRRISSQVT